MSGNRPHLDEDQRALAAMLDDFIADHQVVLDDDADTVAQLIGQLAKLGVWTLGAAESTGGGGADLATTVVALERIGRSWPALGWAAVQAHAAVDVLSGFESFGDLVGRIHSGADAVAVVDALSAHVRLAWQEDRLVGAVDRVDAAHPEPHLLVLIAPDRALFVPREATVPSPLRRTGLGGAFTRSLEIDTPSGAVTELTGVSVAAVRSRLRSGAGAVAAGIAGSAADAAVEYAAGRHQFGAALTALPVVRQALLSQASRTAVILDALFAAPEDEVESLALLRSACDEAIEITASALQSHGGYGYLTEYGAERRLRDAVSLRAAVDTEGAAADASRRLVGLAPLPSTMIKDAS
ncbi:acyl-CoA dehydrogenase family protein [Amycolatopsis thermoflava]